MADGTVTQKKSAQLLDAIEQVRQTERRITEIDNQFAGLKREIVTDDDATAAFADFDNLWSSLTPREQVQVIQLLIKFIVSKRGLAIGGIDRSKRSGK